MNISISESNTDSYFFMTNRDGTSVHIFSPELPKLYDTALRIFDESKLNEFLVFMIKARSNIVLYHSNIKVSINQGQLHIRSDIVSPISRFASPTNKSITVFVLDNKVLFIHDTAYVRVTSRNFTHGLYFVVSVNKRISLSYKDLFLAVGSLSNYTKLPQISQNLNAECNNPTTLLGDDIKTQDVVSICIDKPCGIKAHCYTKDELLDWIMSTENIIIYFTSKQKNKYGLEHNNSNYIVAKLPYEGIFVLYDNILQIICSDETKFIFQLLGTFLIGHGEFSEGLGQFRDSREEKIYNLTSYNPSILYEPKQELFPSSLEEEKKGIYNNDTYKVLSLVENHHFDTVSLIAYTKKSSAFITVSLDGTIIKWNVHEGRCNIKKSYKNQGKFHSADYSHGKIATGYENNISIWNLRTDRLQKEFDIFEDIISIIVFSPDGKYIASGTYISPGQSGIQIFDLDGKLIHGFRSPGEISSLCYSPDGKHLASGTIDKTINIWNVKFGKLDRTLEGHSDAVTCVKYSLSGRRIASGSLDKTVMVWSSRTGKLISAIVLDYEVYSLDFSPNGKKIVVGLAKNIIIWDIRENILIRELVGHIKPVRTVKYSNDGKYILSGSEDKTSILWSSKTGDIICRV